MYQIEEIKTEKRKLNYKKLVICILILLLVLYVSIRLGMTAAQKSQEGSLASVQEQSGDIKQQDTEQAKEIDEEEIKRRKAHFYKEVDDIYNGEPGVKRVFLTFDDGPSDTVTPHILDVLKQYNVKATFFVLGNRVSDHKDLINREYAEGHYIGNHSYTHEYSKIYSSDESVLEEYNKTEAEIKKALNDDNYSTNIFRFPGGAYGGPYEDIKAKTRKIFKKKHIAFLDWNALTYDAEGADTKEEIMENLKKTTDGKENVVLLMHDAADKTLTYETLPDVIEYLQEKGYAFQNMYDLMDMGE